MDENDERELTKRRLVEEVGETVQRQLFRTYSLVGVAVIAAFGYANWDFVAETKKDVRESAQEAVQQEIEAIGDQLEDLKATVHEQTGRINSERERARDIHAEVANQLSRLDVEAHNLATLNEAVSALTEARRQLEKDLTDIKSRTDHLSVVAGELKRLAEELQRDGGDEAATYQTVVQNLSKAEETAQDLAQRPTVYLQFAGGARSRAQELSRRLADSGFVLPGEERHAGAAGKREVRYFYEEDEQAVANLLNSTERALSEMGYPSEPSVKAVDLTGYKGAKPERGVLELWVEL